MFNKIFHNLSELVQQAATDKGVLIRLSKMSEISDLRNLEKTFGFYPGFLEVFPIHRQIIYQNFITPRGLLSWITVLRQVVEAFGPHELPRLKDEIMERIVEKTKERYESAEITKGRAKEILDISVWDSLPWEE